MPEFSADEFFKFLGEVVFQNRMLLKDTEILLAKIAELQSEVKKLKGEQKE